MSSTTCLRHLPTFAEHRDALRDALVDVTQESFFSFAEICDPARFADAVANADGRGRWLSSRVSFTGAFAGVLQITLPHGLAVELLAAFAGLTPDDPVSDAQVLDSTGELANMVCGRWLTKACVHRRFDLRQPEVVPAAAPPAIGAGAGEELLLVNDQPVAVRLDFLPS